LNWYGMREMANPCPVPFPTSLVVKRGSKMRDRMASGIPVPVSEILTTARSPSLPVLTRSTPSRVCSTARGTSSGNPGPAPSMRASRLSTRQASPVGLS